MPITATTNFVQQGQDYEIFQTLLFDNNYQVGGLVVPLPSRFAVGIDFVMPFSVKGGNLAPEWDPATNKIKMLQDVGAGLVEVPGGTDLSAVSVQVLIFGK